MRWERQSTATVIPVGPFVDDTDGKTLEEALTVASIDVQLIQPLDTAAIPPDLVTNGTFAADSDWTKNSWTISAGVANSAAAQDTNLDQTISLIENVAYEVVFDVVTQSAGSVTPILGGTSGTARSTVATFTETIIAGAGSLIRFDAIGFTGTIDNVVIKQVPIPITPAASGSANDMVLAQGNTGTYWLELTANQVAILGLHKLTAFISGALIVWEEFMVVPANVWDSYFGSDKLQVDLTQAAGSTPAGDNLKLMYDGTGYTAETGPASRAQVDNIGAASGGAVPINISEDNTGGAIDPSSAVFVGSVQGGTFASLEADDGVVHDIDDVGSDIDIVYGAQVGGGRTAVVASILANVDGNADEIKVKAYDHVGADWEIIGTVEGSGGSTFKALDLDLLLKHTGTGSELGKVYIRFETDSTTPANLSVDKLLVKAVNIGQSVGYANGRIWVDTVNGVAGTEPFVNGVADKPTNLIASAKSLSAPGSVGIPDFHIINGSTITLAESTVMESYFGDNWTLALGGQDVDGAYFQGAHVTGVGISATEVHYEGCDVGTMSVQKGHFDFCSFDGTVTHTLAGDYNYHNCYSKVAGVGAPIFTKTAGQVVTVQFRNWSGSITMSGIQASDVMTISGTELGDIVLNGADGTVKILGIYESLTDNRTGSPTLIEGAFEGSDVTELQGDWADGGRLDLLLDAIPTTVMRGTDGALTDKAGFSLSVAGILAIWHQLTSAIVTASSIGKLLKDNVDAVISAIPTTAMRGTDGVDTAAMRGTDGVDTAAMRGTDGANTTTPPTVGAIADAVYDEALSGHQTQGTAGAALTMMAYAGPHGPGVYYDDAAANTGVIDAEDGTIEKPVSTIAAVTTLASSLGLTVIYLVNDSQATLAQTYEDFRFVGLGVSNKVTLGSQDVDNSEFYNVILTGTQGGTGSMRAIGCSLTALVNVKIIAENCWWSGDVAVRAYDNHMFAGCRSSIPGDAAPTLTFPAAESPSVPTKVSIRGHSGGIELVDGDVDDTITAEFTAGQLIIAASCNDMIVRPRGVVKVTNNGTNIDIELEAAINLTNINSAVLTEQMIESYAADGVAPTLAQAIFAIMQQAGEFAIVGTTLTVYGLDGVTPVMTFTLNDASDPTSRTRAT